MAQAGKKVFTAERYAARPRLPADRVPSAGNGATGGADTLAILDAIEALRKEVAELKSMLGGNGSSAGETGHDNDSDIRVEIAQMVRSIGRTKTELAAIKHPMAEEDHIRRASSELDEIVVATESATEDILRSSEHIGELLDEILARHPTDERLYTLTEEAGQELINIMEACSFQDITGQRVTKVVKTIRFIQDRILAMIGIWGAEAFADLPMKPPEEGTDESLLNGPALANEGLSQSDIDALFD